MSPAFGVCCSAAFGSSVDVRLRTLRVVFAVLVVIHSPRALYKPDSFECVVRACGLPAHGLCSLFRGGHISRIGLIRMVTVRMPQQKNSAPPAGPNFLLWEKEL